MSGTRIPRVLHVLRESLLRASVVQLQKKGTSAHSRTARHGTPRHATHSTPRHATPRKCARTCTFVLSVYLYVFWHHSTKSYECAREWVDAAREHACVQRTQCGVLGNLQPAEVFVVQQYEHSVDMLAAPHFLPSTGSSQACGRENA